MPSGTQVVWVAKKGPSACSLEGTLRKKRKRKASARTPNKDTWPPRVGGDKRGPEDGKHGKKRKQISRRHEESGLTATKGIGRRIPKLKKIGRGTKNPTGDSARGKTLQQQHKQKKKKKKKRAASPGGKGFRVLYYRGSHREGKRPVPTGGKGWRSRKKKTVRLLRRGKGGGKRAKKGGAGQKERRRWQEKKTPGRAGSRRGQKPSLPRDKVLALGKKPGVKKMETGVRRRAGPPEQGHVHSRRGEKRRCLRLRFGPHCSKKDGKKSVTSATERRSHCEKRKGNPATLDPGFMETFHKL